MVFDGDCRFCRRWIARWQEATGDRVDYLPFQDPRLTLHVPELRREALEKAVHLIEPNGNVSRGAEAVFRSLTYAPRRGWLFWFYREAPGVAPVTERAYRFVAEHRSLFSALTRLFWGEQVTRPSYTSVRWLFLRLVGLVYLIAFVSLWTQIIGLVGNNGILPAEQTMKAIQQQADQQKIGSGRYWLVPTFCWFDASDRALHVQCATGTVLSLLVMIGICPAPCLFLLWIIYLSLTTVCQIFLGYQWDNLLLETGFLTILFAPWGLWPRVACERGPSTTVLWLLRWLVFRLMFASGCVKLLSGDATWRNLTALNVHYETQPLPPWTAWYAHQFPEWFQKASVVAMFGIELVLPFLIFLPRRLRLLSFWPLIGLQGIIALTGNYCFFNLLTAALCVVLLDDTALQKFVPAKWRPRVFGRVLSSKSAGVPGQTEGLRLAFRLPWLEILRRFCVGLVALAILCLTTLQMVGMFRGRVAWPRLLIKLYELESPLRSVNNYGLFAVMTTSRPEIVIEGSNDGQNWLAYEFPYKPGEVKRRPPFVAPHQPRLDWQMWFAALGDYRQNPWLLKFCERLLQGAPEVLALMEKNPFPNAPPRYIRAMVYDYHFTTLAQRRADGAWWRREFKGPYCPALSLRETK
jgi:predicted DCC family thiol-disulfide oxidoreductase YuxK